MPHQVGIIGVGLLGSAIAERLLAAGFAVSGFDNNPERLEDLRVLGGTALASAEQVLKECTRVFLVLPTSAITKAVIETALPIPAATLIIDSTTGDPDEMVAVARLVAADGASYIDATIGGSSAQVRAGEAIVLTGGHDAETASCRALLNAFAARIFHLGDVGSGARMKLAMNLVLGLNRAALAEGLAFARSCGIDPAAALEVLQAGPAFSRVMESKGPKMLSGDFTPQARLSQHRKDVDLILAMAERNHVSVPLSTAHRSLLLEVEAKGFGSEDNSAVFRAWDQQ